MKLINKDLFINKGTQTLGQIWDRLVNLPALDISKLQPEKTALVIVDMINGFAKEGALQSPRILDLIPNIADLMKLANDKGIKMIAFADYHTDASPEFDAYPCHCLGGTSEAEVVDELKEVGGYQLINKNSTNGFLEDEFINWLDNNNQIDTFIITGDCTDICVQQFAITLKTWFNKLNKKSKVYVPMDAVDTYDLGMHDGDLVNVMALYNMSINGVEIVKTVEFDKKQ